MVDIQAYLGGRASLFLAIPARTSLLNKLPITHWGLALCRYSLADMSRESMCPSTKA
jgi:hypothetical protein